MEGLLYWAGSLFLSRILNPIILATLELLKEASSLHKRRSEGQALFVFSPYYCYALRFMRFNIFQEMRNTKRNN